MGARHSRAAILLRNSQGLGTSSGSCRLEQSCSALPLGTHGLQLESSDTGPVSGDPLPSAPADARRVPPQESGSGFTALPWPPFCSAGLLGRSTPGEEGAGSSLQPLYHAQLGPFWGHWPPLSAAGSPQGPPASPAQPLPDFRHSLPRERPAGPGQPRRGLWDPGGRPPPAPSCLLHLPLMVTGLQGQRANS